MQFLVNDLLLFAIWLQYRQNVVLFTVQYFINGKPITENSKMKFMIIC